MARLKKTKKPIEVQKFGGTEELGSVVVGDHNHDLASIETQSKTKLQDDVGEGEATVIRCFTFGMDPVSFKERPPTKQELFNAHVRGIEMGLWADGLKMFLDVQPRVVVNESAKQYSIFIAARPRKGYLLTERPQTLDELVNG